MWAILVLLCILSFNLSLADILVLPYNGRYIEQEFRDMPSSFGDPLPLTGLHGMLVYAEPDDGCESVQPPPTDENQTGKWIILIARYNCSFEMKVRNAQKKGYNGVIVHNVKSDTLQPMSAKNSTGIHIPSVFVGENTGLFMKQVYAGNSDYYIIINSEIPFNINTQLLIPFAVVVTLCFLVMVTFMIGKCIRDRRQRARERLSSSTLNKIPTCKFQKGDPYETCAICLDDYVEGEKLRVLACAHAYHTKCIDPWLTKNRRVCPVCKRKVFAHDEVPDPDSDSDVDSDDTTPLLNPTNRTTEGGTFRETNQNSSLHSNFIRIIRGNFLISSSDHHSINGEQSDASENHTDTPSDDVETRPGTSNPNRDYVCI